MKDASFGLILSLSKDEAAPPSCDASSFDGLRMRRLWSGEPLQSNG